MPSMTNTGPAIAKRVAVLAEEARMNQQELAQASGLSQSTISKLLSGSTQDPRISVLLGLSRALGCALDVLLGATEMPPSSRDLAARVQRLEASFAQFLTGEIRAAETQAQAIEGTRGAEAPAPAGIAPGRKTPRRRRKSK